MSTNIFWLHLAVLSVNEPSGDMPDKWADGLKVNATRMNERRKEVIGSPAEFLDKLAGPSHTGWAPMLNPGFVSKSERDADAIKNAHKSNLENSYDDYSDKLDLAFETVDGVEAKRFKEATDNTKHIWSNAVTSGVLRFTGDKIRGRGPAATAPYWMTNYNKAESMLRDVDILIEGAPYDISKAGQRPTFRTAIQQKLIQAGMQIVQSGYLAAVITAQNTIIKDILNSLYDPTKCAVFAVADDPATSFCGYVKTGDNFILNVRVRQP
ncbi:MAG: hypothetical protein QME51_05500 [Planctomycetota bacterium]|nr:hypothetical protein [Planctomycetota bacterium]MDI6787807.1 hypothetical protein [Planctomycetota bacterium]